jgi:hypothetical protein
MAYEKDPLEIGALWIRTNPDGTTRLTGKIDGIGDVVCWAVKGGSEKAPQWRVKRSAPRDGAVPSKPVPVRDINTEDVPW